MSDGLQSTNSIESSNMQHDCTHTSLERLDERERKLSRASREGEGGQILSLNLERERASKMSCFGSKTPLKSPCM